MDLKLFDICAGREAHSQRIRLEHAVQAHRALRSMFNDEEQDEPCTNAEVMLGPLPFKDAFMHGLLPPRATHARMPQLSRESANVHGRAGGRRNAPQRDGRGLSALHSGLWGSEGRGFP